VCSLPPCTLSHCWNGKIHHFHKKSCKKLQKSQERPTHTSTKYGEVGVELAYFSPKIFADFSPKNFADFSPPKISTWTQHSRCKKYKSKGKDKISFKKQFTENIHK
jgi:hypothetical protein